MHYWANAEWRNIVFGFHPAVLLRRMEATAFCRRAPVPRRRWLPQYRKRPAPKTLPLQFESPVHSVRVLVEEACCAHWARYQQTRFWHRESGGLLFAPAIGSDDGFVRITNVSGPNAEDRRSRYSVILDHDQCITDIENRFEQGLHFVGYWHTHPEKHPSLSGIDRRALTRNLKRGGLDIQRMIAIVIGSGSGKNLIHMSLVLADDTVVGMHLV